ncbi:hypothetical protein LB504_012220 [Fusarium proliferatum]|nr:hypothetical protein LB504_012220 [Fusarium proliferatum]
MPSIDEPLDRRNNYDDCKCDYSVVHVGGCDIANGREEEEDGDDDRVGDTNLDPGSSRATLVPQTVGCPIVPCVLGDS